MSRASTALAPAGPADSSAWTVSIAGAERHDGEGPYRWVINADDQQDAARKALEAHYRLEEYDHEPAEAPDLQIIDVAHGAPGASYPYSYNDLRGIPARTVTLQPHHIRQLAGMRLEMKRRDQWRDDMSRIEAADGRIPSAAWDAWEDMGAHVIELLEDLLAGLGHPVRSSALARRAAELDTAAPNRKRP